MKILTTGEGGMALTNIPELYERMKLLRSHGITRNMDHMVHRSKGPWYYEQLELGFNYRITDIQAALGISQLNRLEEFILRRNKLAQNYDEALIEKKIRKQKLPKDVLSARHLYIIRVSAQNHVKFFEEMRREGIGVNLHYIPVHLQPYYQSLGFFLGQFPKAENYALEAISLPMYPDLSDTSQAQVIELIRKLI